MSRLEGRFEGRVQGVGFRQTVVDVAMRFPVTGRVWNVSDGSVKLLAEGEEPDLLAFHAAILQRLSRNITGHQETWAKTNTPTVEGFRIAADELIG